MVISRSRGLFAAGLLLIAAPAAYAAPAGFWHAMPPLRGESFFVQAEPVQPEEAPPPAIVPEEALPPPILPAPELPGGDPLVELPPEGAPEAPAIAAPGQPGSAIFSFADLAAQLVDSVVYISTAQRITISRRTPTPAPRTPSPPGDDFFEDFFDDEGGEENGADPRTVQSLGAGFVIDASGLIVTNNHVIADADEIVANFTDGSKRNAEVVGVDEKTDLALLKVNSDAPLKAAPFGRSEGLRVGDWVIAIGNPFGFGGTVTAGIVSALDRDINSGPYDHYIQTDASINRGNSGGPLFNIGGEVVGINTAIMSPTGGSIGIGFAVPSEIAVPVIEQLRRFGEVRRGWIGVRIQEVTDELAEGLGSKGALIAGLTDDGPAAEGGMVEGDVVVEFNGKPVESMRALPRLVADTPPGETVDVVVVRDGERVTLELEIGLLDDAETEVAAAGDDEPQTGEEDEPQAGEEGADAPDAVDAAGMFGLTLAPITDADRETYSIGADIDGVLVSAVEPGSEAAEKSVQAGHVIVQVSQQDVEAPEDVVARVDALKSEGRRTVMFLMADADDKMRFVSLRFSDAR
jgi:serine protease Do